jgi:hypothetical protein
VGSGNEKDARKGRRSKPIRRFGFRERNLGEEREGFLIKKH